MNERRIQLQPVYILHRKPFRETSLLLEAFSQDYGRVGLVARGARRGKSRLAGLLQPFQPLLVSWSGSGELHTLTGAETGGPPSWLQGRALISGFYLNELLMRLLQREDPHAELFGHYSSAVRTLGSEEARTLRRFEVSLLQTLGYGLNLEAEGDTGVPLEPDALYHYRLEEGPIRCQRVAPGALVITGRTLIALREGRLDEPEVLTESKRLLRAALGMYLGARPLASRELYRQALTGVQKTNNREE